MSIGIRICSSGTARLRDAQYCIPRRVMKPIVVFLMLTVWQPAISGDGESRAFRTGTGKLILVEETHPVGQSLSTIRISSEGFEHEYDRTFENIDPVVDVMIDDLDGNGYDEIYVITSAAGSGSYGNVIGVASNKDKSLSMVNFPEVSREEPAFRGYLGHDAFAIEKRRLVRSFPVFEATDVNAAPTGGTRKIYYELTPGEAMWQLRIDRVEPSD